MSYGCADLLRVVLRRLLLFILLALDVAFTVSAADLFVAVAVVASSITSAAAYIHSVAAARCFHAIHCLVDETLNCRLCGRK